ncbi:uncharacterized protein LOC113344630 [Papaver somniferum]|uniref:uncharacterized protein LOC113344630 n=1 Tax=Papaver somniferum TaxID=3469 RepID=UPI000E705A61|nr:uncharacterized protein LOC113344630 [Papaver somniferum]
MEQVTIRYLFVDSGTSKMAIDFGTTEFVSQFLGVFPKFILLDEIVTFATRGRNELVYNIFHKLEQRHRRVRDSWRDENGDSILHVSAEVAHNRRLNVVSGAAFQMQREIQWFKEVENTMQEKDRFMMNNKGETAQFLFTENHKDLMEKAEKWMKELHTSCMVVAALIATIAFAAAITVPGGNISDMDSGENGFPVFLHKKLFMLFAITDALALFSSVTKWAI